MQVFTTALLEQARRFQLDSELIFVEWNPPVDRPRLSDALRWPSYDGPCNVRIIEVPPRVHKRFKYSDKLPLFQMVAKNVGIVRARGQFVLATNIDLLFSDELMRFLASRKLDPNCMYRIDRHDAPAEVPDDASIKQQLSYCRKNVIRVNMREGTFPPEGNWKRVLKEIWLEISDFTKKALPSLYRFGSTALRWARPKMTKQLMVLKWLRAWLPYRFSMKQVFSVRNIHSFVVNRVKLIMLIVRNAGRGSVPLLSVTPPGQVSWDVYWRAVEHQRRGDGTSSPIAIGSTTVPGNKARLVRSFTLSKGTKGAARIRPEIPRKVLHTNACGDFTLLSRDFWFDLRGYPEWEMYSFNIDSVFCYNAYYGGAKEVMLEDPCNLYHIEHASGWTPEQADRLRDRMIERGIPWFDWADGLQWIEEMHTNQAPVLFNDETWGLSNVRLQEQVIELGTVPA